MDPLAVIPNWDQHLAVIDAARLRREEQICKDWGHDWHLCAACSHRECLRCGKGKP